MKRAVASGAPESVSLDALLREVVAAAVHEEAARLARPLYVTQRTSLAIVGLPPRDFLRLALEGRFPSTKEKRLVLARTEDVVRYVDAHRREVRPANDYGEEQDDLDASLAKVGARRVGASR